MVIFYCYSDSGPHWYKAILVYVFAFLMSKASLESLMEKENFN